MIHVGDAETMRVGRLARASLVPFGVGRSGGLIEGEDDQLDAPVAQLGGDGDALPIKRWGAPATPSSRTGIRDPGPWRAGLAAVRTQLAESLSRSALCARGRMCSGLEKVVQEQYRPSVCHRDRGEV